MPSYFFLSKESKKKTQEGGLPRFFPLFANKWAMPTQKIPLTNKCMTNTTPKIEKMDCRNILALGQ